MAGSLINEDTVHFIGQASGFAVGANMVTDPGFPNLDNWTEGTWTLAGGVVSENAPGGDSDILSDVPIVTTAGIIYRVQFEVTAYTAGNVVAVFDGVEVGGDKSAVGVYTTYVKATDASSPIAIRCNGAFVGSVDNISVQAWPGDFDAGGGCTLAGFYAGGNDLLDIMGAAGEVLHHDTLLALSDDGGSLAIASGGSWDKTPIVGTLVKCDFSATYTDGIYEITAANAGSITIDLAAGTPAGETVEVWIGGAFPDIATALNDSTLSEDPDSTYRKRYICVNVPMEVDAVTDFVAENSETPLREDDGSRKIIGFYDSISVVQPDAGYRVVSDMDFGQTYYAGARKAFNQDESFPVINPNGKWVEWNAKGNDFGATGILVLDTNNFEMRNIHIYNTIADAGTDSLVHTATANFNITFTNCWFDTSSQWQVNDAVSTNNSILDCYFGLDLKEVGLDDWEQSSFVGCIINGTNNTNTVEGIEGCMFISCLIYKGVNGLNLKTGGLATNCIFFDQTTAGIRCASFEDSIMLSYNNIFSPALGSDNAFGFIGKGSMSPASHNNIMYSVTAAVALTNPIVHDQISPNLPLPVGTLEVDPLFVNPAQGDFRLQVGSPAVSAGLKDIFGGTSTIGLYNATGGDASTANQDTMIAYLEAMMSKDEASPSVGSYDPATDSLEALKIHADTIKAETVLIVEDTNELQTDDYPASIAAIQTEVDKIGTIPSLDGAGQTIGAAIAKIADDNGGATFDAELNSLNKIKAHADTIKAETASIQTETTALDTLTKAAGDGDLAAMLTDTSEIGVAGAGLSNINLPNQTMDITGNLSGSVGSVSADVTTDGASRTASKANVTNLDTTVSSRATSAKQDTMETTLGVVAGDVAGLDGDGMVGTDGANTTVPDAAGTADALHATTDALINGIADPNSAAIADAVLKEVVADHSGTSGSLAELVELIRDISQADTVIDTSDDTQWVLIFNKKGTSTEIMRKNMIDINGAAITATSAVVGAHEHTAS